MFWKSVAEALLTEGGVTLSDFLNSFGSRTIRTPPVLLERLPRTIRTPPPPQNNKNARRTIAAHPRTISTHACGRHGGSEPRIWGAPELLERMQHAMTKLEGSQKMFLLVCVFSLVPLFVFDFIYFPAFSLIVVTV